MSRDCCHRHCFIGKSTMDCCHCHGLEEKTEYAPNGCNHTHCIKCKTKKKDGHRHCVMLETSCAYYCNDGSHYHYLNGNVYCEDCHCHYVEGCTDRRCD